MKSRGWPQYYILLDRVPIAVDMETWAAWFCEFENRRVARDQIDDKCRVSTIFMGLDHNFFGRGDPILFETLICGGPLDGEQWRYATYAEAERGHAEAVSQARIAAARIKAIADTAGAKKP
jgi:hypothetical protein